MNSYDNFLVNHGQDLKTAKKQLDILSKNNKLESIIEALEKIEKIYDKLVCNFIDNKIRRNNSRTDISEIAECALQNMNRNGTEMRMILFAIEEVYEHCIEEDDE